MFEAISAFDYKLDYPNDSSFYNYTKEIEALKSRLPTLSGEEYDKVYNRIMVLISLSVKV